MQKREMEVREALNNETMKFEATEEVAIEAVKFKIAEELVIARKMQSLQFTTNEQQRQSQIAIEYSKLSDKLNEKYGFELDQLSMALKKFDLGKNESIISFQKLAKAQRESEQKAEFDKASPSKEVVAEILKRGQDLGAPQYKQDGTMTFDYFLATMKLALEYTIKHTQSGLEEHSKARRASLKENNLEEYQQQILKAANWENLSSSLIQANLYQALKVPKSVFEKSMQTYMMEPEKRTIFEEEMQKLRDKYRDRKVEELTREQVLSSIEKLEMAKLEAQKKMYMIVKTQKLQPQMINALIKVEKLKADDQFFNETGIEEEDVEPSIKRLDMEKDEAYTAIIEKYAALSKAFLEEKKVETEKFREAQMEAMKKMQAAKGAKDAAKKEDAPADAAPLTMDSGMDAALI